MALVMERRRFLVSLGAGVTMGIAGCSGTSGSAPSAPDSETDPSAVLPPTPEGMTEIRRTDLPPGDTGAEAGALAEFQAEPGERYYTEVLRWPDEQSAEDGVSVYTGGERSWTVYVTNGVFSWAGADVGGTEPVLLDVIGTAEGLTRDYAERTDAIEAAD